MRKNVSSRIGVLIAVSGALALAALTPVVIAKRAATLAIQAGSPAQAGKAAKTPWGEPDLQGIWGLEQEIPLQRPDRFAGREFMTAAERAQLNKERATKPLVADQSNRPYDELYFSKRPSGLRTSLIVDPPDGKIPPFTPEAQKRTGRGGFGVGGGSDNPEDQGWRTRCMPADLPDLGLFFFYGYFLQISQSPGTVAIVYDTGQGSGWQRVIPVSPRPHLPPSIRQWGGDSRGHWEGNTLVVDVTNFTPKQQLFEGSRENLHLIERWTLTDAKTLQYTVTMQDPTTWVRPWTAREELNRQSAQANAIYFEPRCHEGNYAMGAMLLGARVKEKAAAEGKGTPTRR
jgi:hypothetical protein